MASRKAVAKNFILASVVEWLGKHGARRVERWQGGVIFWVELKGFANLLDVWV